MRTHPDNLKAIPRFPRLPVLFFAMVFTLACDVSAEDRYGPDRQLNSTENRAQSQLSNAAENTENARPAPVVAELFTSEGCSSCPPADRILRELHTDQPIANAHIIVLSEHVDYWNRLGWVDPFSHARFSERQRQYAYELRSDSVYTPQMIVNGHYEAVGSNRGDVLRTIQRAVQNRPLFPVRLSLQGITSDADNSQIQAARVRVEFEMPPGSASPEALQLVLAAVAHNLSVQVPRGENAGRNLSHVGVVRTWHEFDDLTFSEGRYHQEHTVRYFSEAPHAMQIVAFIQNVATLNIPGAGTIDLN